jgi:RAT1-interacting protein
MSTAASLGKRSYDDRLSPTASLDSKTRRTEDVGEDDKANTTPLLIKVDLKRSQTQMIGIQKPVQVTSFSYDEKRRLFHDDRSKKYYHLPPKNANLNRGYETKIERDESINEHLDSLLDALMQDKEIEGHQKQADLITWRGMMTKLCTILYEDQQGFEMNIMMLDGTLYIEEHVGEAKLADRKRSKEGSERSKRNGYYGYSFESWTCHSWREWGQNANAWDGDVNTNVQWCSVVKTKLGNMRLVSEYE